MRKFGLNLIAMMVVGMLIAVVQPARASLWLANLANPIVPFRPLRFTVSTAVTDSTLYPVGTYTAGGDPAFVDVAGSIGAVNTIAGQISPTNPYTFGGISEDSWGIFNISEVRQDKNLDGDFTDLGEVIWAAGVNPGELTGMFYGIVDAFVSSFVPVPPFTPSQITHSVGHPYAPIPGAYVDFYFDLSPDFSVGAGPGARSGYHTYPNATDGEHVLSLRLVYADILPGVGAGESTVLSGSVNVPGPGSFVTSETFYQDVATSPAGTGLLNYLFDSNIIGVSPIPNHPTLATPNHSGGIFDLGALQPIPWPNGPTGRKAPFGFDFFGSIQLGTPGPAGWTTTNTAIGGFDTGVTTPEPSTIVLVGMGLIGLAAAVRKRRAK